MLFNRLTTKIFLSLVLGLVVFVSALVAFAQPTPTINYQGKLTDTNGLAVADGSYNMRFYLYNAVGVATTSAIWTEVLTGTDKVQVTNGLFSVMLGSTTPLTSVDFNQALYLGVEIGGSGSPAWDGEMSPRKPLGTVPAAFEAYELGGVASSSFLRSDQADTASGLLTFSGGLVSTASSTITNLTTSVATTTTLVINGESFTDLTGTGLTNTSGVLTVATATLGLGNGTYLGLTDTPSSFTANRIPYTNSGATALTDSANFTFDGTNLGLGSANGITWNGTRYLYASSTNDSISFGEGAGTYFGAGATYNTALGYQALYGSSTSLMTGDYNFAVGYRALYRNTTGSSNNALGYNALNANTTGSDNNALGYLALASNTTGTDNNAFGWFTLQNNTTGSYNNAVGEQALDGNISGSHNNALGDGVLFANTTGSYNIGLGYWPLSSNNGTGTIAIGYQVADNALTVDRGIFIGYDIDAFSTTQDDVLNIGNIIFGTGVDGTGTTLSSGNIGIGTSTPGSKLTVAGEINIGDNTSFLAGIDLNGVPLATGSSTLNNWYFAGASSTTFTASSTYNYGIGEGALRYVTSGSSNIAIGKNALAATAANPLTGSNNIAIGPDAGLVVRGGFGNNLIGSNAGDSITTGYYNHMIGTESGNGITSGYHNTMIGFRTGMFITTGAHNTYIGSAAGENGGSATSYNTLVGNSAGANATGNYNTFMGYQAADNLTSGARNIMIGAQIDAASTTRSNQLNIGNLIFGTDVDGTGTTTSTGNIGIGTSTPGSKLTVAGTIQATDLLGGATNLTTDVNGNIIRDPSDVRLKENIQTLDDSLDKLLQLRGVSYEWIDKERFGEQTEIGFIAQEVDEVLPEVVRKGGDYWSLNTRNIVAVVVEAVKELYARLVTNESKVEELENRVNYLESLIEQQSAGGGSVSGGGNSTPPPPPAEPPVVEETPETPPVEEVMVEEEIIQEEVVVEETPETPPVEEVAPEELPAPAVEEVVVENSP